MAILPISKVVPDTDILADQFNQMVDAIQDLAGGHDHTGAAYHGKPIDHVHLIDAGTHEHANTGLSNTLDWHMDAVQGSADHPLHGLTAGYYAAGAQAQPLVFTGLHHQFTAAEAYGYSDANSGPYSNLLGWTKVWTAADVGLATILGVVGYCGGRKPDQEPWPAPSLFRAGTTVYARLAGHGWGAPGAWMDAASPYSMVVPTGGLGVLIYINAEADSYTLPLCWWQDNANCPSINVLAWGLLT